MFRLKSDARETIENWRNDYNEYRPHSSLDQQTPSEFVADWQQTRTDRKAEFLTFEMVNSRRGVNAPNPLLFNGPVFLGGFQPVLQKSLNSARPKLPINNERSRKAQRSKLLYQRSLD